ncbi:hypothetical protein GMJAKD_02615 [Candidatus Electrothrix aarhusensis]
MPPSLKPEAKRPICDKLGVPRIPPDCAEKYRHWSDGQPLLDTLLELGALGREIEAHISPVSSPEDWRRWRGWGKAGREKGK